MDSRVSLYLDLARFLAALIVLLHHGFQPPYYEGQISFPGRSAVIIFFVISGYVIAYVCDTRETGWRSYAIARLARVYSVALPSLMITWVLYVAIRATGDAGAIETYNSPAIRLAMSALFLNQIWNYTIQPLNNGPYWSLCYEVWYYLFFGVWCFARRAYRAVSLLLLALIVGPRILLLMPIWLFGVILYHVMKLKDSLSNPSARPLFVLSVTTLLLVLFVSNPADSLSRLIRDYLTNGYITVLGVPLFIGGDWNFPSDYLTGFVFACTVYYSYAVSSKNIAEGAYSYWVRLSASYTFSLYLYHFPLLIFFYVMLRKTTVPPSLLLIIACTIVAVVVLGKITEHRKSLYIRFFIYIFEIVMRTFSPRSVSYRKKADRV